MRRSASMSWHVVTEAKMALSKLRGPFYKHGLILIPAWLGTYIHYKEWNKITYTFSNFKGASTEVWDK